MEIRIEFPIDFSPRTTPFIDSRRGNRRPTNRVIIIERINIYIYSVLPWRQLFSRSTRYFLRAIVGKNVQTTRTIIKRVKTDGENEKTGNWCLKWLKEIKIFNGAQSEFASYFNSLVNDRVDFDEFISSKARKRELFFCSSIRIVEF